MTKLGDALRKKYKTPHDALKALGLDESLIKDSTENLMNTEALARKISAIATRTATIGALGSYLKPRLALDAKIDMSKVFSGVTGKNFTQKKPAIAAQIRSQAKGKLAKDADLDQVEQVLDMLEKHEIDSPAAEELLTDPENKAIDASAISNLDLPEKKDEEATDAEPFKAFLKEKGVSDEDIVKAMDMFPKHALDADESEEEKAAREAKEKAATDEKTDGLVKKAEDALKAKDAEMKDMVKKPAMDAAIKLAVDAAEKRVRDTERGIRAAAQEVIPYVGELSADLVFDSADQVRGKALEILGIDTKGVPPAAFQAMLKLAPKSGAKPVEREAHMGMDAAQIDKFAKKYPGAERIQAA